MTEDFAPGCVCGGQEQVLHCALLRLKCERRVVCGVKTWIFHRMPQAFLVWSLTELRTQSCSSEWLHKISSFFCCRLLNGFSFLSYMAQMKKEEKELLLKNTEADICPDIYYLFCIILQNPFYLGKLASLCEHAAFYQHSAAHSYSHSQPGKTTEQLEDRSRGSSGALHVGTHRSAGQWQERTVPRQWHVPLAFEVVLAFFFLSFILTGLKTILFFCSRL